MDAWPRGLSIGDHDPRDKEGVAATGDKMNERLGLDEHTLKLRSNCPDSELQRQVAKLPRFLGNVVRCLEAVVGMN